MVKQPHNSRIIYNHFLDLMVLIVTTRNIKVIVNISASRICKSIDIAVSILSGCEEDFQNLNYDFLLDDGSAPCTTSLNLIMKLLVFSVGDIITS